MSVDAYEKTLNSLKLMGFSEQDCRQVIDKMGTNVDVCLRMLLETPVSRSHPSGNSTSGLPSQVRIQKTKMEEPIPKNYEPSYSTRPTGSGRPAEQAKLSSSPPTSSVVGINSGGKIDSRSTPKRQDSYSAQQQQQTSYSLSSSSSSSSSASASSSSSSSTSYAQSHGYMQPTSTKYAHAEYVPSYSSAQLGKHSVTANETTKSAKKTGFTSIQPWSKNDWVYMEDVKNFLQENHPVRKRDPSLEPMTLVGKTYDAALVAAYLNCLFEMDIWRHVVLSTSMEPAYEAVQMAPIQYTCAGGVPKMILDVLHESDTTASQQESSGKNRSVPDQDVSVPPELIVIALQRLFTIMALSRDEKFLINEPLEFFEHHLTEGHFSLGELHSYLVDALDACGAEGAKSLAAFGVEVPMNGLNSPNGDCNEALASEGKKPLDDLQNDAFDDSNTDAQKNVSAGTETRNTTNTSTNGKSALHHASDLPPLEDTVSVASVPLRYPKDSRSLYEVLDATLVGGRSGDPVLSLLVEPTETLVLCAEPPSGESHMPVTGRIEVPIELAIDRYLWSNRFDIEKQRRKRQRLEQELAKLSDRLATVDPKHVCLSLQQAVDYCKDVLIENDKTQHNPNVAFGRSNIELVAERERLSELKSLLATAESRVDARFASLASNVSQLKSEIRGCLDSFNDHMYHLRAFVFQDLVDLSMHAIVRHGDRWYDIQGGQSMQPIDDIQKLLDSIQGLRHFEIVFYEADQGTYNASSSYRPPANAFTQWVEQNLADHMPSPGKNKDLGPQIRPNTGVASGSTSYTRSTYRHALSTYHAAGSYLVEEGRGMRPVRLRGGSGILHRDAAESDSDDSDWVSDSDDDNDDGKSRFNNSSANSDDKTLVVDDDAAELGYVEDMPSDWSIVDAVGKVGGKPVWLDPRNPLGPRDVTCAHCKKEMPLLIMVNAPDDRHAFSAARCLYVFFCRHETCQETNPKGAVRVWRQQISPANLFFNDSSESKRERHDAEKVLSKDTGLKNDVHADPPDLWKEFDLVAGDSAYVEDPMETTNNNIDFAIENTTQKPVDDFMNDFEVPNETVQDMGAEEARELSRLFSSKNLKKRGIDSTFIHFQQTILRDPEQVLRFYRLPDKTIAPLWTCSTRASGFVISSCPHCGSERKPEFQVIPTLLSYLKEYTVSFDSLLIYTCFQGCDSEWQEELVLPLSFDQGELI